VTHYSSFGGFIAAVAGSVCCAKKIPKSPVVCL